MGRFFIGLVGICRAEPALNSLICCYLKNTVKPTPRPLAAISTARIIAVIFTHFCCIIILLFAPYFINSSAAAISFFSIASASALLSPIAVK